MFVCYSKSRKHWKPDKESFYMSDKLSKEIEWLFYSQFTFHLEEINHHTIILLEDYDRGEYRREIIDSTDENTILSQVEDMVRTFSLKHYQEWCREWDNYDIQFGNL